MSRENDIVALKELKNHLLEADALADLANEEWEKARKLKAERENTKFVFKPLPTDNYKRTKADFVAKWKNFFMKTGKFKAVFLGLYSLAMLGFAGMLFLAAFKNDGSSLLKGIHQWNEVPVNILTCAMFAAFPVVGAVIPWASLISSDQRFYFLKNWGIALGITGVLFAVGCDWTNSFYLLPVVIIGVVAAFLVCLVLQLLCWIISKIPVFSAKQRQILAEEKQKDIDNEQSNQVNEVKEREQWEKWWEQRQKEMKEEGLHYISLGDTAMDKAKEHLAAAEASDILGENEKAPEIIDMLIHFIESRRADSIKEALHEYDTMQQNQKLLEIEAIKVQVEIEKAKKENADRQFEMEQQRRHQIEMEAQARRNADLQSQIAANTAAAAASAERVRKQAAAAAADAADEIARIQNDVSAIYRNDYYNS